MPMLCSLGQHGALQEVQDSLMTSTTFMWSVPPSSGPRRERENPNASGQDASLEPRRPHAPRV